MFASMFGMGGMEGDSDDEEFLNMMESMMMGHDDGNDDEYTSDLNAQNFAAFADAIFDGYQGGANEFISQMNSSSNSTKRNKTLKSKKSANKTHKTTHSPSKTKKNCKIGKYGKNDRKKSHSESENESTNTAEYDESEDGSWETDSGFQQQIFSCDMLPKNVLYIDDDAVNQKQTMTGTKSKGQKKAKSYFDDEDDLDEMAMIMLMNAMAGGVGNMNIFGLAGGDMDQMFAGDSMYASKTKPKKSKGKSKTKRPASAHANKREEFHASNSNMDTSKVSAQGDNFIESRINFSEKANKEKFYDNSFSEKAADVELENANSNNGLSLGDSVLVNSRFVLS
jgi:hypothetical protein